MTRNSLLIAVSTLSLHSIFKLHLTLLKYFIAIYLAIRIYKHSENSDTKLYKNKFIMILKKTAFLKGELVFEVKT